MQLGDTIETAMWLDGRETKDQREAFEREVRDAITNECRENGFIPGPIVFHVKHPYDDRVPPVPEHIDGPEVRLLVAEATAESFCIETVQSSFISDIEPRDLLRLREITKRSLAKTGQYINDYEADDIIEALGPIAAEDALRRAVMN